MGGWENDQAKKEIQNNEESQPLFGGVGGRRAGLWTLPLAFDLSLDCQWWRLSLPAWRSDRTNKPSNTNFRQPQPRLDAFSLVDQLSDRRKQSTVIIWLESRPNSTITAPYCRNPNLNSRFLCPWPSNSGIYQLR